MYCTGNLLIVLILNCVQTFGENIDYCNNDLCKQKGRHIACENDGRINRSCADYSEIIELVPEIKEMIVEKHNEFRNKLALGEVPGFETASRMATIQWHDELASIAELNVKSCTTTHDQCRNTYNFPRSGQNIARRTTHQESLTKDHLEYNIYHGISRWFQEHENCPKDGTTMYTAQKKKCGHFTVIIAERNTHLGCAFLLMKKIKTVLTCNYAWTNVKNKPLYSPGNSTSECKTGRNEEYQGLCSIKEQY